MEEPRDVAQRLLDFCHAQDWAGHDPYDALNSPVLRYLPILDHRIPRLILTQVLKKSPVNIRPLLRVPKTHNSKAIALFLAALLKLRKLGFMDTDALIPVLLTTLESLRSPDTHYWCWGYSFPWQTRTLLIPRGMPNLVCTAFVADALLDAYDNLHEPRYLTMAVSAAEYIVDTLYRTSYGSSSGFRYPHPSSTALVHNANFLGAALLCRVYRKSGHERLLEPALEVARYSASQQHPDGSWDYGEAPRQRWVDNFHTGYNLCALHSMAKLLDISEFATTIRRGFYFYRDHFFEHDGVPKYFHNRTYPIDIHSAAQSIITLLTLRDLDSGNYRRAMAVFEWTMTRMWDKRGFFYYQALPAGTNRIPYIRWSQAWMLLALATLLEHPESQTRWPLIRAADTAMKPAGRNIA
jgi:hypothetical protein